MKVLRYGLFVLLLLTSLQCKRSDAGAENNSKQVAVQSSELEKDSVPQLIGNQEIEDSNPETTTNQPFEKLYELLIKLEETENDELLNAINVEFDKYLSMDRDEMDIFRFDDRFWDYASYSFFSSLKKANPKNLNFNLFEFVLKIKPYYFATGEVDQALSALWAEIAYLKTNDFLEYIEPMDSTNRMEILLMPSWWEIPADSFLIKIKDEDLKKDLRHVFQNSG